MHSVLILSLSLPFGVVLELIGFSHVSVVFQSCGKTPPTLPPAQQALGKHYNITFMPSLSLTL